MLNVHDGNLVVDEKGIYSVEKFIISRRLMYWQVYMHKTVIAADRLLIAILQRVRETRALSGNDVLDSFLHGRYGEAAFRRDPALLDRFALLDDDDVMVAIKGWARASADPVLGDLCRRLAGRRLNAIRVSAEPFAPAEVQALRDAMRAHPALGSLDPAYYVTTGQLHNSAYSFADNASEIGVLFKDGSCRPISEASDQLDRHFLEKQVTKHYLCFPKELRDDLQKN